MKIETRDLQKKIGVNISDLARNNSSEAYEKSDRSQKSKVLCASLKNYDGAYHIAQKPEKSEKNRKHLLRSDGMKKP